MYDSFTVFVSSAIPLPSENVDTDQIIPARFLKAVERKGFGENLFRDWRYDREGNPIPGFVLNDPRFSGRILVAGRNFGSGSSREHAAWALYDHGFRVVVSSFFADIFRNNALNNGLLPVVVVPSFLEKLFSTIAREPRTLFQTDLENQKFTIIPSGDSVRFEIGAYKKHCLLNGLDDVDFLTGLKEEIAGFENRSA